MIEKVVKSDGEIVDFDRELLRRDILKEMMKYGITDIRYMYTNDIRFLKQFTKDGE